MIFNFTILQKRHARCVKGASAESSEERICFHRNRCLKGAKRMAVIVTHQSDPTENFYLSFRFAVLQCNDDDALQFINERFLFEAWEERIEKNF